MKPLLAVAALWLLSLSLLHFTASVDAEPQTIEITPAVIGLGDVAEDTTHEVVFLVTNPFAYPVDVLGTKASCGCIELPDIEGTLIEPGKSLELSFKYSTRRGGGEREAAISVFCTPARDEDDTSITSKSLALTAVGRIVARVVPEVCCTPASLNFGALVGNEYKDLPIEFERINAQESRIREVISTSEHFTILESINSGPNVIKTVVVRCQPSNLYWKQHLTGTLIAKLDNSRVASISVPLSASYVPRYTVTPHGIIAGTDEEGVVSKTIRVSSSEEFTIVGCDSSGPECVARVTSDHAVACDLVSEECPYYGRLSIYVRATTGRMDTLYLNYSRL